MGRRADHGGGGATLTAVAESVDNTGWAPIPNVRVTRDPYVRHACG